MGLLSFTKAFAGPPEDRFWAWFQKNSDAIFHFEENQERVFDQLSAELHRVHSDLTFEFGPVEKDNTREFVISAGGIKSAFPSVEKLHGAAPKLARWKWVKFRPKRAELSDIEMSGRTLRTSQVRYKLYRDGAKVGIVLFIDGYSEQEEQFFGQAGYLLLDEALGEYAVETYVGFIEFSSAHDPKADGSQPVTALAEHLEEVRQRTVP
jgi:hypothetical protein